VRPVRPVDVVADVLPLVEPQLAAKRIVLDVRAPDAGAAPLVALADRDKLAQIVLNLLSNAAKFTPEGGRVTVELCERLDDEAVADVVFLRVADTGIGIPADKLDSVFEPFVQVRKPYAPGAGGTGLGLSISRDLARGMGGDVRARSTEGRGSSFTVTLRRAGAEDRGPS
jgi:signal transduction histidine kinase